MHGSSRPSCHAQGSCRGCCIHHRGRSSCLLHSLLSAVHTLANCGADRLYVLSERLKMQRHPVSCRLLISEKVEIVQEGAGGQGRAGEPGHECAAGGTELRAAEFAAVTGAPACLESILPRLLPDEAPAVLGRASLCSSCCSACGCGRLPVTGDPLRHGHGDAERPYFTHSPLLLDKLHCDAATGLSAGTPRSCVITCLLTAWSAHRPVRGLPSNPMLPRLLLSQQPPLRRPSLRPTSKWQPRSQQLLQTLRQMPLCHRPRHLVM